MILVDTAPLVAIVDPRDALHSTALKHLAALSPGGLWVCEAVVMEACFHLPHRMQRERLRAALGELTIDSLPTGDPGFRSDVFAWLVKYADHEPDWADASAVPRMTHANAPTMYPMAEINPQGGAGSSRPSRLINPMNDCPYCAK
jgi:predicted nucleic acid-binding protein